MDEPPSDEELRIRFGDRVEIRRALPTKDEVIEKNSWLERIATGIGYETWMWRSWKGVALGVIIITPNASGIIDFWQKTATSSYNIVTPYLQSLLTSRPDALSQLALVKDQKLNDEKNLPRFAVIPIQADRLSFSDTKAGRFDRILWRIANGSPLDERGGLIVDGSWHKKGAGRLIYAAASLFEAVQNTINLVGSKEFLPVSYMVSQLHVIGTVERAPRNLVDANEKRLFGTKWLVKRRSAILEVPSIHVDRENFYIINLDHLDLHVEVVQSHNIQQVIPT